MAGLGWGAGARALLAAFLLALASGCATTNGDARDPIEGFNRSMFAFNDAFDEAIGKPVATAYRDVLPEPVRDRVRNFFSNIADLFIGVNNLLQGKPLEAVNDWARFSFNTVFGIFGLHDVASEMGLEKQAEDFGQTFGRWGAPDGAYIVWPFLGSSTARDSIGLLFDYGLDPVARHKPKDPRYFMQALRIIGVRSDLLEASRILEEAALDKYVFQRDAYLQRRRGLIYDGRPPRDPAAMRSFGSPAESAPSAAAQERSQAVAAARLLEEPARAPAAPAASTQSNDEPRLPNNYPAVIASARGGQ